MFLTPSAPSSRFPLIAPQSASAFLSPRDHCHVIHRASMDSHGGFPPDWTVPANNDMTRERHSHSYRPQQAAQTSTHYQAADRYYGFDDGDDWYAQSPQVVQSDSHRHLKSAHQRHLPSARSSPYAHPRAPEPQAATYHHENHHHGPFIDTSRHRHDPYRLPTDHRPVSTSPVYNPASFAASSRPVQYTAAPRLSTQYEAENNSTLLRESLSRYEVDAWQTERSSSLPYRQASPPRSLVPPHTTSQSPMLIQSREAVPAPTEPVPLQATPDLSLVGQLCAKRNCYRQACSLYGDFCEFHKPSRLCKVPECRKCAKTGGFCISHGGGRRCQSSGCAKSAKEGGYCIAHGGGKRRRTSGCEKAVSNTSGFCVTHST